MSGVHEPWPEDLDDYDPADDLPVVSLDAGPCPECGEPGACSYDAEGRPLIHALSGDSE